MELRIPHLFTVLGAREARTETYIEEYGEGVLEIATTHGNKGAHKVTSSADGRWVR